MILLPGFPDASLNLTMGWGLRLAYTEKERGRESKRGPLCKCAMGPFWRFLACHCQHLGTPLPNPSSNLLWKRPERPQNTTLALLGKHAGHVISQCSPSTKHTVFPPTLPEIRSPPANDLTTEKYQSKAGDWTKSRRSSRKSTLISCR